MARSLVLVVACVFLVGCTTAGPQPEPTSTAPSPEASTSSTATAAEPDHIEEGLAGAVIGRDFGSGGLVLFGGWNESDVMSDDTWILDPGTEEWKLHETGIAPSGRGFHTLTPVDSLGHVVLFGGSTTTQGETCVSFNCLASSFLGDMWTFSTTDGWEPVYPSGGPGPRAGHGVTYDPANDVVVLFGGMAPPVGASDEAVLMADTWLYHPADQVWEEVDTSGPAAMAFHQMVYDPVTGRALLWGGFLGGDDASGDMWAFDVSAREWTAVSTGSAPEGRWSHTMTFDPGSRTVVMIGGQRYESGQKSYEQDVWVFDPSTSQWERRDDVGGVVVWAGSAPSDGEVTVFVFGFTGRYNGATDTWTWPADT